MPASVITNTPESADIYGGLKSLLADGSAPETTMGTAESVRSMITQAIYRDQLYRDWKRSRLKGLVDGNPPYNREDLIAAGRADECNVNWRIARYFLSLAKGLLYDTLTEADTFATIKLANERTENDDWSAIATEEFDWLQRQDQDWDFTMQQSCGQAVHYGTGPIVFEDQYDWRPWSVECKTLLVPETARSNINRWQWAALVVEYSPDQLYRHIMNEGVARSRGWDVDATRNAIMNAHPLTRTGVMYQNWSWHQDMIKTGSFYYADQCKMVRTAHFYCREFPREGEDEGRISVGIIDLDTIGPVNSTGNIKFLYRSLHQYDRWQNCIHPIYWDHDMNGLHYAVTGLGVEMYAALEYENRLLCHIADDAFAPKLLFKPTTASDREKLSIAQVGRYGLMPAALELVQQAINPLLQDSIAVSREVQSIVASNLSQFRSNAISRDRGNPPTATQVNYEAGEQAKMGKTQLARVYEQWDWVYDEKFRRACSDRITKQCRGGSLALEFQDRCKKRGVTLDALRKVDSVTATRVVGQGSAFMRQQALEFLLGMLAVLPESGRSNLVRDVVASRAGQSHVDRYAPRTENDPSIAAQQGDAAQWIAAMKEGVAFVPSPQHNPLIYANTFTSASESALAATQQGGDPAQALSFVALALPAAQLNVQRMGGDKSRLSVVKQLTERLSAVSTQADQLHNAVMQAQQERAQAAQQVQAMSAGADPETQVGMAKVQSKHQVDMAKAASKAQLDWVKEQHREQLESVKTGVDIRLKDAETAAGLHRNRIETAHGIADAHVKTQATVEAKRTAAAAKPKASAK